MLRFLNAGPTSKVDHAACSGCSLCLLVCPVWRSTRDLRLTPHGRAKALQHGASITDIASSVESCTLCTACEPVCPEKINLVDMILALRAQLPRPAAIQAVQALVDAAPIRAPASRPAARRVLLPDPALRACVKTLARVRALLDCGTGEDDGADIALALETGAAVATLRIERFLASLRGFKHIIAADGLLLRRLKLWLPKTHVISLGEALISLAGVRRGLNTGDLYVIEARAYHADQQRLVAIYDRLRADTGCAMNLDLLRMAIPATARSLPQRLGLQPIDDTEQTRWILHGRTFTRIVAESVEDMTALTAISDSPVVHVADLADDGHVNTGKLP